MASEPLNCSGRRAAVRRGRTHRPLAERVNGSEAVTSIELNVVPSRRRKRVREMGTIESPHGQV